MSNKSYLYNFQMEPSKDSNIYFFGMFEVQHPFQGIEVVYIYIVVLSITPRVTSLGKLSSVGSGPGLYHRLQGSLPGLYSTAKCVRPIHSHLV